MKKHYSNMRKIKPTINTRDVERKKRMDRFKQYAASNKKNAVRQEKVRKENEQLIGKITDIATKSTGQFHQEYPSKQRMFMTILAKHGRKMRKAKIARENQLLAARLNKKESTYDRAAWEKDWKHHDHVLNHLSKSAQLGLPRVTKSVKSPKRNSKKKRTEHVVRKSGGRRSIGKKSNRLQKAGLDSLKGSVERKKEKEVDNVEVSVQGDSKGTAAQDDNKEQVSQENGIKEEEKGDLEDYDDFEEAEP